jgi:ankyrin repeat protein
MRAAVRVLLEAGGDPTLKNKAAGSTAFHLAVQNTGRGGSGTDEARAAQREIIEEFLRFGISPSIKDGNGKTVLDWAKSGWIREMLGGKAL